MGLLTNSDDPGQENLGDYQTKHRLGHHHVKARPFYLHSHNSPYFLPRAARPSARQGFIGKLGDPYVSRQPLPTLSRHFRAPVARAG